MGKEIIERPGTLPTKKAAALPAKRSAGALISNTLTAFVQPLQVARNYGDEWCRQGRTIGVVYFPDGAGRNAVDEARKIHGRWLREFAKLSEAEGELFGILVQCSPKDHIDRSSALSMLTTLFAALGMKKTDAENAMLLSSAA